MTHGAVASHASDPVGFHWIRAPETCFCLNEPANTVVRNAAASLEVRRRHRGKHEEYFLAWFGRRYAVDVAPDILLSTVWRDRRQMNFIRQNIWDFVPELYRVVLGREMPEYSD